MNISEQEYLENYRPQNYPHPSLAVDIVIFTVSELAEGNYRKLADKEMRVLLIRRKEHPFKDCLALPGGFVRPGETVGQAASRELKEESGISQGYLEQLYTFSEPSRDPRTWVVSCAHMALVDSHNITLHAGTDALEAQWFRLSAQTTFEGNKELWKLTLTGENTQLEAALCWNGDFTSLKNTGLAFDHDIILATALRRLRNKINYTDIAFNLMPPTFTLTQLQQVYEILLGKTLLKAAFRRKIADLVEETEDFTQDDGHRPARLFRKKQTD